MTRDDESKTRDSQAAETPPCDARLLLAEVVTTRIESVIRSAGGARVIYAIVDLGPYLTSTIGQSLSTIQHNGSRVEVAIHPELAVTDECGISSHNLISTDVATRFRNRITEGTIATIFSVPGKQMEGVIQSLGSVSRIDERWLLEQNKANIWAAHILPGYNVDVTTVLTRVLQGLMESDTLVSAQMFAMYCAQIKEHMTGGSALSLVNAVNAALPTLRLPRNSLLDITQSELASNAAATFRSLRRELQPYLYLLTKSGELRSRSEMRQRRSRLLKEGYLTGDTAELISDLIEDRNVICQGAWQISQQRVAEIAWSLVCRFFVDEPEVKHFGKETIHHLDSEHPDVLTKDHREMLSKLRSHRSYPRLEHESFFAQYGEFIHDNPSLYKRWLVFIFRKPVEENDDLLVGLIKLTKKVLGGNAISKSSVLLVRLRDSDKVSFWKKTKNWYMCAYLRDRYRGLDRMMLPNVKLDFGLCWDHKRNVLDEVKVRDRNSRGSSSARFEFEAHVVDRQELNQAMSNRRVLAGKIKAQLSWTPDHLSFARAYSLDLRQILPDWRDTAILLRSSVSPARGIKGSTVLRPTVHSASSIIDCSGGSGGFLASVDVDGPVQVRRRLDEFWLEDFERLSEGSVSESDIRHVKELFARFHRAYTSAVRSLVEFDGEGLGAPSLVLQAQCYCDLLMALRAAARTDTLVRDVWAPLLQIGTATVDADLPAVILTPWHPLRLLELAAKAKQASDLILRVMESPASQHPTVSDLLLDRIDALTRSYYPNIGLLYVASVPTLVVETEYYAGYSLMQPSSRSDEETVLSTSIGDVVEKFGEIATQYLRQRPHEKANFSTVILDAQSEDLPVQMARYFAREIEREPHLRCDLTVSHQDSRKLRLVYAAQNRRIGHEIDPSLTSEASRIFLSRLRVKIAGSATLDSMSLVRRHDVVLLHNVVGRHSVVVWRPTVGPVMHKDPRDHAPHDTSWRKIQVHGSLTTSVYLAAPVQIAISQAYIDSLHDTISGSPSDVGAHYLPSREVRSSSVGVAEKIALAHRIADWVVTYDWIVDRRFISDTSHRLRILRYSSEPRSIHNVIVSTEIAVDALRSRLADEVARMFPDGQGSMVDDLVFALQQQLSDLSGGVLMRAHHWDNYAMELIGVLVAQRELHLLLADRSNCRVTMFFLDEFKAWLALRGEIADILAVRFHESASGGSMIELVVVEAKCVDSGSVAASKKKSWKQLEATYATLIERFTDTGVGIDRQVWRNRLSDMLIEHMRPWGERERIAGMGFDEWIDSIRSGDIDVEVSGHSIISVPGRTTSATDCDLSVADPEKPGTSRRRLAQWVLGADCIRQTIRDVASDVAVSQLHVPEAWGVRSREAPTREAEVMVPVVHVSSRDDIGIEGADGVKSEHNRDGADQPSQVRQDVAEVEPDAPSNLEPSEDSVGHAVPTGWKPSVHETLMSMSKDEAEHLSQKWLDDQVTRFRQALQTEERDAPIQGVRLTPNAGIVHIDGSAVTVKWLSSKRVDLLTQHSINIVRIEPQPGHIAVAIQRPERRILHLSEAWGRRQLQITSPEANMALFVGEREDTGEPFYLSLDQDFAGYHRADPHTLVSGTTGSGKGILTSNLILDLCAFNDPRSVEIYLIDPKHGADYLWARDLPHLRGGIVARKDAATALLRRLVRTMEDRYSRITEDGCANIDQYNRKHRSSDRIPRIVIFFDEVANWMQDEKFRHEVESVIDEIATKSRAAGLHLFMIYQRADNRVMSMQLRTNLGNRLILRLGDEGSSKIALGDKGAERLLGKGHIIAKLGSDEKIYGQVPFIGEDEIVVVADAIKRAWQEPQE